MSFDQAEQRPGWKQQPCLYFSIRRAKHSDIRYIFYKILKEFVSVWTSPQYWLFSSFHFYFCFAFIRLHPAKGLNCISPSREHLSTNCIVTCRTCNWVFLSTVFLTLLVLCSSFTSSEKLSYLDTLFLTFWATKIWKTAKHLYIRNTPATCVSFPQRWQQQLGCFDLCVGFVQASASCCDIQTELRVISLEDLWLPHKSRKPADQHQLPGEGDVCLCHRPATATTASLVSPNGSLFFSRLTNDQGWSR